MSDDVLERAVRAQEQATADYAESVRSWKAARRERIATAALAGILSDSSGLLAHPPEMARIAIKYADALIAELDKEDGR